MKRILFYISYNRRLAALVVALLVSVIMMSMGTGSKESFAKAVTTTVFNTGRFAFSWGIYMMELWSDNKRLRLQNLELSYQINFNKMAAAENERLRMLLGFKKNHSYKIIPSNVIGHDVDRILNSLILDVGSRDGVKKYMAVVTAEGLVGRVIDVYPFSCSVQLLMDYNARISAYINSEKPIEGIVRWEGGEYLRIYGIEHLSRPVPGQEVFTTGVGGTFPPGLLIGTVADQNVENVTVYASINIKPAVNYSKVIEVFVLTGSERSDIWDDAGGSGSFPRPEVQ